MSLNASTSSMTNELHQHGHSMTLFDDMAEFSKDIGVEGVTKQEGVELQSIWVTQENGEQLHLRHFKPVTSIGRRVFMLHGEAESGRVYYDSKNRGLAWYLAHRGYEVFVADLAGRGRSMAGSVKATALSVTDIITSSIPRFLQAISNTPSNSTVTSYYGCPADIWIGHGFGCVLLAGAWARMPESMRSASQMVFFSGRRRLTAKTGLASLLVSALNHRYTRKCVERWNHFPAAKLGIGSANESVGWYLDYTNWISAPQWQGADDFDYVAALTEAPLPSILHLVAPEDSLYSNLQDVRLFVDELGEHDARVLCLNYSSSGERHNHLSLLLSNSAEQDVFEPLQEWLTPGQTEVFSSGVQQQHVPEPNLNRLSSAGASLADAELAFA